MFNLRTAGSAPSPTGLLLERAVSSQGAQVGVVSHNCAGNSVNSYLRSLSSRISVTARFTSPCLRRKSSRIRSMLAHAACLACGSMTPRAGEFGTPSQLAHHSPEELLTVPRRLASGPSCRAIVPREPTDQPCQARSRGRRFAAAGRLPDKQRAAGNEAEFLVIEEAEQDAFEIIEAEIRRLNSGGGSGPEICCRFDFFGCTTPFRTAVMACGPSSACSGRLGFP